MILKSIYFFIEAAISKNESKKNCFQRLKHRKNEIFLTANSSAWEESLDLIICLQNRIHSGLNQYSSQIKRSNICNLLPLIFQCAKILIISEFFAKQIVFGMFVCMYYVRNNLWFSWIFDRLVSFKWGLCWIPKI